MVRPYNDYEDKENWFNNAQKQHRYEFEVMTRRNVRPPDIQPSEYGHHRSCGTRDGNRRWAFKEEKGKKLVLKRFPNDSWEVK